MNNLNTVTLQGRLTRNTELKKVNDWVIASFSIAVNQSRKINGEWTDETSFFDCKMFGKVEKLASYMTKGSFITVSGSLKQERWEKDGIKYSKIVVVAKDVFLTPKSNNQETQEEYYPTPENVPEEIPENNMQDEEIF